MSYSSSSHDSSIYGVEEIKRECVEQEEELATIGGGTGDEDNKNGGTESTAVVDCSAVEDGNLKVLISGTDGGIVYAREEVVDGSTVVNYIGNDVYWANDQDSAEQDMLNQEIIEHLKSLNIQPKLEVEEGSRVERGMVAEWEDGLIVRAEPNAQFDVDEFEFGGTEEFKEELAAMEVEQGQAVSGSAGEE